MNYTEIVDMALSYSDREDTEVTSRVDNFLKMAESRINRALKVGDMSARARIDLTLASLNQRYFALPTDYGGLRSIKWVNGTAEAPLHRLNPEQFTYRVNSQSTGNSGEKLYFNIVANQLQMFPTKNEGKLEITYYQRLIPLTATETNNWLSDNDPDCYIFAILVEISSFTKDADSFAIWEGRFKDCLEDMKADDAEERWSGTPMQIRVG